jgi:hypothetical protein
MAAGQIIIRKSVITEIVWVCKQTIIEIPSHHFHIRGNSIVKHIILECMKRFIFLLIIISAMVSWIAAQNSSTSTHLAEKIAQKMADTLQLSSIEKSKILSINLELQRQKLDARTNSNDMAVLTRKIQSIENKRDSLYKTVLSVQKYELYMHKKQSLIGFE